LKDIGLLNKSEGKMRDPDRSIYINKKEEAGAVEKEGEFCLDWQETFDAALDIIALISEDFEILKINKTGYTSLGKPLEELIGKKCYEVVHGLDAPIEGCSCGQAKRTGVGAESEIEDNGRQYLTTASPIFDENNKFIAFAHTVKDITDIRKAEQKLKETNESLEKQVEARTAELVKINEKLIKEIEEKKKSEGALKESESAMREQTKILEQKNLALGEIIAQIEIEKNKIKSEINTNVQRVIIPTLEKMNIENDKETYKKLLEHHLTKITSGYGSKITNHSYKLSPRELEICNLIKANLTSKDISQLLNISVKTVDKHRRNIRKKLELSNKDINLASALSEI
jgi:PAS domain S-box-containing protein